MALDADACDKRGAKEYGQQKLEKAGKQVLSQSLQKKSPWCYFGFSSMKKIAEFCPLNKVMCAMLSLRMWNCIAAAIEN